MIVRRCHAIAVKPITKNMALNHRTLALSKCVWRTKTRPALSTTKRRHAVRVPKLTTLSLSQRCEKHEWNARTNSHRSEWSDVHLGLIFRGGVSLLVKTLIVHKEGVAEEAFDHIHRFSAFCVLRHRAFFFLLDVQQRLSNYYSDRTLEEPEMPSWIRTALELFQR